MKTLIASCVSIFLAGMVIGSYIGYRYYERHITNEAIEQMVQGIESSDKLEAIRSIRTIELIEAGNTSK